MARRPRSQLPDGVYHVTARGVARCLVFLDDEDRLAFLGLLAAAVGRHAWCCHALCLMGNHYHVVVECSQPNLSAGFHRMNGMYAQSFNSRHGRWGHLFGERFAALPIESERHLEAACRYVLENPVRAGLCERPEDWRWSGVRGA